MCYMRQTYVHTDQEVRQWLTWHSQQAALTPCVVRPRGLLCHEGDAASPAPHCILAGVIVTGARLGVDC